MTSLKDKPTMDFSLLEVRPKTKPNKFISFEAKDFDQNLCTFLEQRSVVDFSAFAKSSLENDIIRKRQISLSCTIDIPLDSSLNMILNQCAVTFGDQQICTENLSFRINTSAYMIEGPNTEVAWKELLETLKVLKFKYPKIDVIISGFQFLWQISQTKQESLNSIFEELRNYGVQVIESSSFEFEGALTNSEILKLHKSAHLCKVPTVAKVELNKSLNAKGLLWKNLFTKLESYLNLQKETDLFLGFMVEPAPNTIISLSEYLYATMVVKYLLRKHSCRVIAPFWHLTHNYFVNGSSSENRENSEAHLLRLQSKIFSILCSYGIDDIGHLCLLDHSKEFFQSLMHQAKLSGFNLLTRNSLFTMSLFNSNETLSINRFFENFPSTTNPREAYHR